MDKIKSGSIKILTIIICCLLFYGLCTKMFQKKDKVVYVEKTYNVEELVPEYYDDNQVALIYFEDIYKYFNTIESAESCKERIVEFLLNEEPDQKVWIVNDIEKIKDMLTFKLVYENLKYQVKIDSVNIIVYRIW